MKKRSTLAALAIFVSAAITAAMWWAISSPTAAADDSTPATPTTAAAAAGTKTTTERLADLVNRVSILEGERSTYQPLFTALDNRLTAEIERSRQADAFHDRRNIPSTTDHVILLAEGFHTGPRTYRFCYDESVTVRVLGAPGHGYFA